MAMYKIMTILAGLSGTSVAAPMEATYGQVPLEGQCRLSGRQYGKTGAEGSKMSFDLYIHDYKTTEVSKAIGVQIADGAKYNFSTNLPLNMEIEVPGSSLNDMVMFTFGNSTFSTDEVPRCRTEPGVPAGGMAKGVSAARVEDLKNSRRFLCKFPCVPPSMAKDFGVI